MKHLARPLLLVAACAGLFFTSHAAAESTEFDFKDPKGVNGVTFVMDSKLEPIIGLIGGVEGSVQYDPEQPESFGGEISIDLATITFINPGMTKALKGNDWLNITDQFKVTVAFNEVLSSEPGEETGTVLRVAGTLSFGDVQLDMELPIEATHVPGGAAERGGAKSGDLLVLRSMLEVSRLDLGINEDQATDKVGETITVLIPIVGYSQ